MDALATFQHLGLAAALGLLVGLQREHAGTTLAGIRTFPLFTVFGTFCALLAGTFGAWLVAAGLLAVCALLVTGNLVQRGERRDGSGITTEIAALVMFLLGAYLVVGEAVVAVVVAGALAVLLHLKPQMHALVKRIEANDFKAVMQFVLISLVILPLLPDRTYGPYDVLNPRNVWWMVVLIVGIELGGYVLLRLAGERAGTLLGGVLGGLVSSTATTVAFARRAREAPQSAAFAALVVMIASTTALLRVLIAAAVVAPMVLAHIALPIGVLLASMVVTVMVQFALTARHAVELPRPANPAELRPALIFAAIYAGVTIAIAAGRDWFGESGLYLVALISGLTDMDAITLSTSRLMQQNTVVADLGWRVIVIAALSNLVFKGAAAWTLGGTALGRRVAVVFGIPLLVGIALIVAWPRVVLPAMPAHPTSHPVETVP
jgi:uncharacterized membrane protein (DUF4010 family)